MNHAIPTALATSFWSSRRRAATGGLDLRMLSSSNCEGRLGAIDRIGGRASMRGIGGGGGNATGSGAFSSTTSAASSAISSTIGSGGGAGVDGVGRGTEARTAGRGGVDVDAANFGRGGTSEPGAFFSAFTFTLGPGRGTIDFVAIS